MTKYTKTLLIAGVCAVLAMGSTYVAFGATSLDDAATKSQDNAFSAITNWFKKGVKIGDQGVGGVTQFNGTIINNTTTNGLGNPVTFGDDVRIDGKIWRGTHDDSKSVWIDDSLRVEGSITQGRRDNGLAKATINVKSDGTIEDEVDNTNDGSIDLAVSKTATGTYYVSVGNYYGMGDRYFLVTPYGSSTAPTAVSIDRSRAGDGGVYVYIANVLTDSLVDQGFTFIVF